MWEIRKGLRSPEFPYTPHPDSSPALISHVALVCLSQLRSQQCCITINYPQTTHSSLICPLRPCPFSAPGSTPDTQMAFGHGHFKIETKTVGRALCLTNWKADLAPSFSPFQALFLFQPVRRPVSRTVSNINLLFSHPPSQNTVLSNVLLISKLFNSKRIPIDKFILYC